MGTVQEVLAKLGVLVTASNTTFVGLGVNWVDAYLLITSLTTSLVSLISSLDAPSLRNSTILLILECFSTSVKSLVRMVFNLSLRVTSAGHIDPDATKPSVTSDGNTDPDATTKSPLGLVLLEEDTIGLKGSTPDTPLPL